VRASHLAALLHARKVGKDKWRAFCPAHGSRHHRTLQITQGRNAVLLRCWSMGCSPAAITAALGLSMSDLFDEAPPNRAQWLIAVEIANREQRRKEERRRIRLMALEKAGVWEEASNRLGKLLASYPGSARIAALFHWALGQMRRSEQLAMDYGSPGSGFPPLDRKLTREDVGPEIAARIGL